MPVQFKPTAGSCNEKKNGDRCWNCRGAGSGSMKKIPKHMFHPLHTRSKTDEAIETDRQRHTYKQTDIPTELQIDIREKY